MTPRVALIAHDMKKDDIVALFAKVKSEFATKKAVKGSDISVTTTEGVVALTGTVATAKEKSSAEKIAKLCGSKITVDVVLKDGRVADFAQDERACGSCKHHPGRALALRRKY